MVWKSLDCEKIENGRMLWEVLLLELPHDGVRGDELFTIAMRSCPTAGSISG